MASPDELWLVDFGDPFPGEPAHHRPAAVLGPPRSFGPMFPFALVVPATTTRRGLSLHVEVEPDLANGLDEVTYLQCELLRSVNVRRLRSKLGDLDPVVADDVRRITGTLLGLAMTTRN